MDWEWDLAARQCAGCGICADVCRYAAIRMTRDMAYPEGVIGACTGCMACVEQCPFAAIGVRELSPAADIV